MARSTYIYNYTCIRDDVEENRRDMTQDDVQSGKTWQKMAVLEIFMIFIKYGKSALPMLRSYHAENARSRPIPEANLHWARLVLR